ncbi:MAG TPA: DUF6265 family protein [Woeseiaceae bacterium]|nr:DUF6265 family protein [Woeseiaceae bacterium]
MKVTLILSLLSLPARAVDIAVLDWLSGCWSYDGREPGSGEVWMPPAGGTMLAMSRTVKQSKTIAFEFMQILTDESGSLVLAASPSGQATATFKLIETGEYSVVFENPDHDFPQRILYRRDDDRLSGRVEGVSNGKPLAIEFPMTRVDCDAFGL